jgi:hypothetical protein
MESLEGHAITLPLKRPRKASFLPNQINGFPIPIMMIEDLVALYQRTKFPNGAKDPRPVIGFNLHNSRRAIPF